MTMLEFSEQELRRLDGYGNVFFPKTTGEIRTGFSFITDQGYATDLYLANGFARRIVDSVAEEMTRAGICIKDIDEELEKKALSKLESINLMHNVNEALKWARAFGGGCIVMGVNDGNALDKPINPDTVKDVEFLRVYDRFEMSEMWPYRDPNNSKFGKTEIWRISPSNNTQPYAVHETRVLIFDGESLPNKMRQANMGWGNSVFQKCREQIFELTNAHKWATLLLQRMQQAVHGIPNLSDQISTTEGEKSFTKRLDIVDRVRNAQNTVAIDAEETYDVKSQTISGIDNLLEKKAEALSAVSGVPMFLLMGQSMGGLNNGDTNKDAWYANVEAMQNDQIRKPIDTIVTYVLKSQGMEIKDDNYKLEFNPLGVISETTRADTNQKNMSAFSSLITALSGAVNNALMDEDECRDLLAEYEITEDYIDSSITPERPEIPLDPNKFPPGTKPKPGKKTNPENNN